MILLCHSSHVRSYVLCCTPVYSPSTLGNIIISKWTLPSWGHTENYAVFLDREKWVDHSTALDGSSKWSTLIPFVLLRQDLNSKLTPRSDSLHSSFNISTQLFNILHSSHWVTRHPNVIQISLPTQSLNLALQLSLNIVTSSVTGKPWHKVLLWLGGCFVCCSWVCISTCIVQIPALSILPSLT